MTASKSVAITYVPADCGSVIYGKSKAPKAFRDVGIVTKLENTGISVTEHQALETPAEYAIVAFKPGSVRLEALNVEVCQKVLDTVSENLSMSPIRSPFQLILGGECGMLPAVLSAYWRHAHSQSSSKRVGLIYIDADTDLNSPLDPNFSGTHAGMNMTHLTQCRGGLQSMKEFVRPSGEPVCDGSNTVLFGTNMQYSGNKPEHFGYLLDNGYKVVSSAAVARKPEECARDALRHLEERVDTIVVHLDVDAIDPQMFPLANLPNYTGVTFEAMMNALGVFMSSEKVAGLTVAEVNPDHDPQLEMVERLTNEIVGMLVSRC